jgi:enolase
MSAIRSVRLDPVYDSRGRLTVEATVELAGGAVGRAAAPSGASTSSREAHAFPEGGVPVALQRFDALVRPALQSLEVRDSAGVDRVLHEVDGTPNFSHIGGNSATAVSVATARAAAREQGLPLWKLLARPGVDGRKYPSIVGNCMNGGVHAMGGPEIQEFIAFAEGATPADSIAAVEEVHRRLGIALKARFPNLALGRGDEGGWVAPLTSEAAVELLARCCGEARDALGVSVHPGLDLAASEFYRNGVYHYRDRTRDADEQLAFLEELVERYDLRYIEDPFDQDDWSSFARLTRAVGRRTLIVGDDLYSTRAGRLAEGIRREATNAVLVKVNQVGTLTDTLETVDLARSREILTVTSHRSGEVPDDWLTHVAVAAGSRGIKCGVLGGERVAKLNELLRLARGTSQG